jgi:homocysteine S-methyltransferase
MNPLEPFFDRQGFVMLDGGLATEMENQGAVLADALWSARMLVDSPELVQRVHRDYLLAGADVIATASYQASFDGFAAAGIDRDGGERLLQLSVDLALLARESFWADYSNHHRRLRPLVAASIGPYGASLHDGSEYHGNYGVGPKKLSDFHLPRLEVMAATGADLFAFETIPSLEEAEVLMGLLERFPDKYAWLSFSCRDGAHVCHGERFAECAAAVAHSPQIVAIGVNCTAPRHIASLLGSADGIGTPLAAYPNSGERWDADRGEWAGQGEACFPVAEWYRCGARIFGGCCRTVPADIARMRADLEAFIAESQGPVST